MVSVDTHISGSVGNRNPQPRRDLRRRVPAPEVPFDDFAQRQVDRELGRLGAARTVPCERLRAAGAIFPATVGVATQLAGDRRRRANQPPRDRPDRLQPASGRPRAHPRGVSIAGSSRRDRPATSAKMLTRLPCGSLPRLRTIPPHARGQRTRPASRARARENPTALF